MVPFLDLKSINGHYRDTLRAAFERVLDSGWVVLGQEVEQFEAEFAVYCGVRHCIGVGNGLDAMLLVLKAWGVGPGDEVIVPSNTFIATFLAVTAVGAQPVPVEPSEETFNIDPESVERAVTDRTRVILPVHLYGQTAEMDPLRDLARHYGLKILEDCAQSHGAKYQGRRSGGLGDAGCFSFYPERTLGRSEMGEQSQRMTTHFTSNYGCGEITDRASSITTRLPASIHVSTNYRPPFCGRNYRSLTDRTGGELRLRPVITKALATPI